MLAEIYLRRISDLAALSYPSDLEIRQIVMSAASIMEAYVDAAVSDLITASPASADAVGAALIEEMTPDFSRSWARRSYWLRVTTGANFSGQTEGQQALLLVDLRNAMAHGSGGLSRWQSQEPDGGFQLKQKLRKSFYVESASGNLLFTRETAVRAIEVARSFVLWVDLQVPKGRSPA